MPPTPPAPSAPKAAEATGPPFPGVAAGPGRVRDITTALTVYAVVQIVLPSKYVIGPLGGAGAPAGLLGLVIGLWWLVRRLSQADPRSLVRQPLKPLLAVLLGAVWVSYLMAAIRPTSTDEQLSADRALISLLAYTGLALAAMDGVSSRERLDTLLRVLALLGGFEAALGILQSFTQLTFVEYLHLPGLVDSGSDQVLISRGSFLRPAGTALHPIEYGVTLAMLLPIALHYAVSDVGRRGRAVRWLPVAAIALALPLSISRSALLCTAVSLAVLLTAWPAARRRIVYAAAGMLAVGLVAAFPGLFRTILNLFAGIGQDTSAASRADSYGVAWSFISQNPLFGRGCGTFLPRYRILDNQYLGSFIDMGAFGLASMIVLFGAAIVTATRLRATDPVSDDLGVPPSRLGPALGAAIAAGALSFAFFDALAFPMIPSMLFLAIGCTGALRRLEREAAAVHGRPAAGVWDVAAAVRRRWPVGVAGVLATVAGCYAAVTAPGVFFQQADVLFIAPESPGADNPFQAGNYSLVSAAGLVSRQVGEDPNDPLALSPKVTILDKGVRQGVWVRLPNDGGQWATNFDRAELDVEVSGPDPAWVRHRMAATVDEIRRALRDGQLGAGAPEDQLMDAQPSPLSPPVLYRSGERKRAMISALLIGGALTVLAVPWLDVRRAGRPRRPLGPRRPGRLRRRAGPGAA